jgi:hypothetical protein
MNLGELKAIIDSLTELHGADARVDFMYQKSSGRTGVEHITGYQAFCSNPVKIVRFTIGHPRGEQA